MINSAMNDDMILVECSDDEAYNPAGLPDRKVWIPTVENIKSMLEKMKSAGVDALSDFPLESDAKDISSATGYNTFRSGFETCSPFMSRSDAFNASTSMNAPNDSAQRNPSLISWKQN
ncbi:unnamed protein product [Soboliphyme baturini]|uniref:Delta-aminolevulinic acid dehydratase n=1 Tax=Soboliphyme baturini TaxID=241478 RepID=A0A183ITU4_9BILA|nr:unnamed protein product [Soboliphyme baturini]